MAQTSITQLPQAQALTGTESVPIVQGGVTVQTTTGAIAGAGALNYPFLTVGSSGLTQARFIATGSGLTTTDNGAGNSLQINLVGAAQSLNSSGNGIQVKTNTNTVTSVSLAVTSGLTITNADGTAGNPTIGLGTFLQNFASLTGTGILAIQSGSVGKINILGTTNQIAVAGGDGSSNPTISLANNPVVPGSAAITVPNGSTAQRAGSYGAVRYNTDLQQFEGYTSTGWNQFSLTGGVTSFSGGATGLLPNTATTGAIVLSGVVVPTAGGTGATTLTGYVYGNGTGTMTASTTIPTTALSGTITNAQLANSSVTYNGVTVSLGGSGTITAASPNALTLGTGLLGGSYNGSLAVTASIDTTVVATLSGTQTLTNKSMSGASNTFTSIPNSALTNNSVTFNGSTVALGGSATITANTTNSLTFNNSGTGATSGTAFNGSTAYTISYNTVGASPLAGSISLTTLGTVTTGVWNATPITNSYLANSSITINGNAVSLGGSTTVTAATPNALTFGTGLTGTSSTFNGSSAVTVALTTQSLTAGTYGTSTAIPSITVNSQGVITAISTNPLNSPAYQGTWNASTNTPTLTSSVGTNNNYYIVSVAGTTTLNGISLWSVGDWVIFNGTTNAWEKINGSSSEAFSAITVTGLTGYMYANGSSQVTASTTIPTTALSGTITNAQLANSSVTFNGVAVALGASGTITANTPNSLTFNNSGLGAASGTAFNGGTAYTISYNTVGASPLAGSSSIVTVGTVTSGTWNASTITVPYGGTGLTSLAAGSLVYGAGTAAFSTLAIGTSGYVLTSNGSAPVWTAGSSIAVGTATNLAGGTSGAVPYQSSSGTTTFLSLGTTNYVLTAGASAPQYVAQSTLSVGSATNATNTGITANTTDTADYITFVNGTSGNLPQLVNSSITVNPSKGTITGGIAGGAF
jgi:hypothetical protein